MENSENSVSKPNESIAKELSSLAEADQHMRAGLESGGEWDENLDVRNTDRLKEIIKAIGWPSISKVGIQAAEDAWIIAQHSDHDPVFQEICLQLMKDVAADVPASQIAFLEDRVRVNKGELQLYGTQRRAIWKDGEIIDYEVYPIEDESLVDSRRAAVGLESLHSYLQSFKK